MDLPTSVEIVEVRRCDGLQNEATNVPTYGALIPNERGYGRVRPKGWRCVYGMGVRSRCA